MKIIRFGPKGTVKWHEPFWQPWGITGCLWRLVAFLALLFALLFLLSLFRSCEGGGHGGADLPDELLHPRDTLPQARVPVDTMTFVRTDIDSPGPYLPDSADNVLPPLDTTRISRDEHGGRVMSDRFNVLLDDPDAGDDTFRRWAAAFKRNYPGSAYRIAYYDPLTRLLQVVVPPQERVAVMRALPGKIRDISFLVFAEGIMENHADGRGDRTAGLRPNDPVFRFPNLSWPYAPIQAFDAWAVTQGSPTVTVAVVDSYFDLNHEELNGNRIVKPYSVRRRTGNVAPGPDCPRDNPCFFHGTFVASLAVGTANNGRGLSGIAPRCRFMPVSLGHPEFSSMLLLQGVLYAIYQGANVINCSIGFDYSQLAGTPVDMQIALSRRIDLDQQAVWRYAFKLADARRVTIVWAAGNENVYAGLDASKRDGSTVRVAAVDRSLRKAGFSNFGYFPERHIDAATVSAPGVDVFGAQPFNGYTVSQGTSFAAPIVTGAVALMKSVNPRLSNAQIVSILRQTGRPLAAGSGIGPLLQIRNALVRSRSVKGEGG